MSNEGWRRVSDNKPVDIKEIKEDPESFTQHLYYKEEPYGTAKVSGQIMFVTYSPRCSHWFEDIC